MPEKKRAEMDLKRATMGTPNMHPLPDVATTSQVVDVVNFSAYAPPRIEPMQEFAVNIYAYMEQQREKMHAAVYLVL